MEAGRSGGREGAVMLVDLISCAVVRVEQSDVLRLVEQQSIMTFSVVPAECAHSWRIGIFRCPESGRGSRPRWSRAKPSGACVVSSYARSGETVSFDCSSESWYPPSPYHGRNIVEEEGSYQERSNLGGITWKKKVRIKSAQIWVE